MHTGWNYQPTPDPMDKYATLAIVAGAVAAYLLVKGLYYFVTLPIVLLTSAA